MKERLIKLMMMATVMLSLVMVSCGKDEPNGSWQQPKPEEPKDTVPDEPEMKEIKFDMNFIMVDSLGRNLLNPDTEQTLYESRILYGESGDPIMSRISWTDKQYNNYIKGDDDNYYLRITGYFTNFSGQQRYVVSWADGYYSSYIYTRLSADDPNMVEVSSDGETFVPSTECLTFTAYKPTPTLQPLAIAFRLTNDYSGESLLTDSLAQSTRDAAISIEFEGKSYDLDWDSNGSPVVIDRSFVAGNATGAVPEFWTEGRTAEFTGIRLASAILDKYGDDVQPESKAIALGNFSRNIPQNLSAIVTIWPIGKDRGNEYTVNLRVVNEVKMVAGYPSTATKVYVDNEEIEDEVAAIPLEFPVAM